MDKLVRVSDLIIDFIYKLGVDTVFTVTGGGAMFLNDSLAVHSKIKTICNHHEQACAMAAVGYAKYKNSYASAIFTTGCGATNSITGVLDAWQDNVPCFFISGQVKRKETTFNAKEPLRQLGVQEANIIPIVSSITKYAVMMNEPEDVLYELQKAAFYAKEGRPGPVWIDVPLDIQGAFVNAKKLKHFKEKKLVRFIGKPNKSEVSVLIKKINLAKRPIIIIGNGVRLGGAISELNQFITKSKIPFATSYLAADIIPNNHPQYVGRLGIKGDRAGNFAVQNADLILSIGCHLSVALTGFEYNLFGREAELIVVDIDANEHKKNTVKIAQFIHADAKLFIKDILLKKFDSYRPQWNKLCSKWKAGWPVCLPEYYSEKQGINKYVVIKTLEKFLKKDSVVVSDAGSAYYVTSQSLNIYKLQRYITSGAQADMGFTLPAAIGVSLAKKDGQVIGITGDGSFQMNIQELQTIVHHQLPIKILILNNNGYLSIRSTQKKFFSGREIGTDKKSGVSFPSTKKIANAYGIDFVIISNIKDLLKAFPKILKSSKPFIMEIICPHDQEIIPTASSKKLPSGKMISKPLEDMYPFLSREEFQENMIIKYLDE